MSFAALPTADAARITSAAVTPADVIADAVKTAISCGDKSVDIIYDFGVNVVAKTVDLFNAKGYKVTVKTSGFKPSVYTQPNEVQLSISW